MYGQYCPIAQALEILGERWTLLIIRDMLTGTRHFNDLMRGLPGLSRGLLAKRLRQLQDAGIIERRVISKGRKTTEYHLTEAGNALLPVIHALLAWGAEWAFGDPSPEHLDPLLLMWWMHDHVDRDQLPDQRVVIQFDFHGVRADAISETYWLVLAQDEVNVCLSDPGYGIDIVIATDLAIFLKVWLGRLDYNEAIRDHSVQVMGIPRLTRAFPRWFTWSPAAPVVRAARQMGEKG